MRNYQAFKVMEVELNFMYDALHTKMAFVHSKTGYFCRFICSALIAACFQQFASHPHHKMFPIDKNVSYTLLGGAVVLEMVALFNLLFSDWVVVSAKEAVSRALTRLPLGRWEKRWSDSMSQFSCIHFCLDDERLGWLKATADLFGVRDVLDEFLLIMQPALMSTVAGIAEIRFQDTCEEAKKFFKQSQMQSGRVTDDALKNACQKLLDVKTAAKPVEVKGDRSKSLLFDACILANNLRNLRDQWKIMSRIWVELLCYGASHCRPSDHARQLAQGGEFVTLVWLLMVHFGLGEQFRIHAGHARAKLLVDK